MCGISGFCSAKPNQKLFELLNNKNLLNHRGPDDFSNWTNLNYTVCFFHNRLSIIDIDNRSRQPMVSSSGRYVITFNGEIYNYKALKINLLDKYNILFKTNSDTEVLLECIEIYGLVKTLNLIRGMFSFVIHDNFLKKIYIVRDYIGEKPLYFHSNNNELIFSSEIKLFKKINIKPKIDLNSLENFKLLGYNNGEMTLLNNVKRFLPGYIYEIDYINNLNIKKFKYFQKNIFPSEIKEKNNFNKITNNIEKLLIEILDEQMTCDRNIGFFLSSGIDSSLLATLASINFNRSINTFTLKFNDQNFDESIYAANIAKYLNTNHYEFLMGKNDIIETVNDCNKIYCDPILDSSQLPTVFLCKNISKHVSVVLGGDGGDEIFSGYDRYKQTYYIYLLNSLLSKFDNKQFNTLIINFIKIFLTENQKRKIDFINSSVNIYNIYLALVSYWSSKLINVDEMFSNIINKKLHDKYDILDELMYWDLTNYLPNNLLNKLDRASMNFSLEARSPYLDINLISYIYCQDRNYIHSNKLIQKSILKKYLPSYLINKQKKGFGSPISTWIRNELKDFLFDEFTSVSFKNNEYINSKDINFKFQKHINSSQDWGYDIWASFVLHKWYCEYGT